MSIVAGPIGDELSKEEIIETLATDLGTDKTTDAAVAIATDHADCGCKKNRKTILFILLILLIAGAIVWYFKTQNPA